MPGMDGLETARRIRALPGAAGCMPIVALTANVSLDDSMAYQAAGMNDLVPKPAEDAMLLAALARHVWRARQSSVPAGPQTSLPAAAMGSEVIDVRRVRSWQSGLRATVSQALFADCLRQLRDMVPALQTALELRHAPALKQATHAMIGVAGNYGLSALETLLHTITVQPEAVDPGEQAARVRHEIDRAQAAVASLTLLEAVQA